MDDSDKVSVCIESTLALANSPTVPNNDAQSCQPTSAICTCSQKRLSWKHKLAQEPSGDGDSVRTLATVCVQSNDFNVKFRKYVMNQPTIGLNKTFPEQFQDEPRHTKTSEIHIAASAAQIYCLLVRKTKSSKKAVETSPVEFVQVDGVK